MSWRTLRCTQCGHTHFTIEYQYGDPLVRLICVSCNSVEIGPSSTELMGGLLPASTRRIKS
jgi:hypothetical protein